MRLLKYCLVFAAFLLCHMATAQRKNIPLNQADPRFTISAQRHYGFGNEEYWFYVQNNTNEEYHLVVNVTIRSTCHDPKNFDLGVNKVVVLKPGGKFTPQSDWSHIYLGGSEQKDCRKKDGDSYTYLAGISYQYKSIKNVTQEKLKAEQERKQQEADKAAKAEQEKKQREDKLAQEAAAAKKKEEDAKKQANVAPNASTKTTASSGSNSTSGTGTSATKSTTTSQSSNLTSTQTSNATAAESAQSAQQKQQEYEESQRLAREAAAKQEAALKAAEEQEAKERQQKYDEWKEKKNQERQAMEAASVAASATFLYYFAGIIYDGMDSYNPDFSYRAPAVADQYKPVLYAGIEVGYSGSYFPMLFSSSHSTMVNGKTVDQKNIITKDVITVNLNAVGKVGLAAENYGAFAYFAPQAGFSPVFDAYNFSPLVGGFKAFGGLKWVKGYVDYRTGGRRFYTYSLDAEEYGDGNFDNNYNRIEYGVRFTTNPDSDYRRSHISLGFITEKINAEGIAKYLDPETNSLRSGKTPPIKGYTFQWHKDHMFNLYINAFPTYIYSGDVSHNSGPLKVDKATNTGVFVELGFIRSFDFFGSR